MGPWQKPYSVPLVRVLSTLPESAPFPGKALDRAWKERAAGPGFASSFKRCTKSNKAASYHRRIFSFLKPETFSSLKPACRAGAPGSAGRNTVLAAAKGLHRVVLP